MKIPLSLLMMQNLFMSGCSTIAAGGAEITGLSLLSDRPSRDAILAGEAIEDNASANDALITDRVKAVTEKSTVYLMGLVHRNEGAAAIDAARHHKFAFTRRVHGRDCYA